MGFFKLSVSVLFGFAHLLQCRVWHLHFRKSMPRMPSAYSWLTTWQWCWRNRTPKWIIFR